MPPRLARIVEAPLRPGRIVFQLGNRGALNRLVLAAAVVREHRTGWGTASRGLRRPPSTARCPAPPGQLEQPLGGQDGAEKEGAIVFGHLDTLASASKAASAVGYFSLEYMTQPGAICSVMLQ